MDNTVSSTEILLVVGPGGDGLEAIPDGKSINDDSIHIEDEGVGKVVGHMVKSLFG